MGRKACIWSGQWSKRQSVAPVIIEVTSSAHLMSHDGKRFEEIVLFHYQGNPMPMAMSSFTLTTNWDKVK